MWWGVAAVNRQNMLETGSEATLNCVPLCCRAVLSTALIEEVIVSRVGHFTCPVAAGALLLGQHPMLTGSSGGSSAESAQLQAVLRLKHDPMVAALDNASSPGCILQVRTAACFCAVRSAPQLVLSPQSPLS